MEKTYRTFIAVKIEPEPELLEQMDSCRENLAGEAIKWVEENNLHLTLKFLGDTTEIQIAEIKKALDKIASQFHPFTFLLEGVGYFKSGGEPKVVFAGIKNFTVLQQLAGDIETGLEKLGFEKETRAFKPHLTLGRIKFLKNKRQFFDCVEKFKNTKFQQVNINEILFYQSILKPHGPVYLPLKTFKLK